jgi:gluconate 5-dehydrogenase
VTGSSQGIGLAEHGAEVVLNGRDRAKLDAAVRELADTGARVSAGDFDVTDADAVKRGVDAIEGSTGPIDILINNAGMQFRSPLEEFPVEC